MSCDDLDAFFDGELAKPDAAAFREHLATCERCQSKLRGRMLEEVAAAPHATAPKVIPFARPARRLRRLVYLAPLLAAAAAIAAWIAWPRATGPAPLRMTMNVEHRTTMRGTTAHAGDELHVAAHGEQYRAIWVFLDDQLVATCPGAPACRSDAASIVLDFALTARGTYTVIVVGAARPIANPGASVDASLAAAVDAGAHYEVQPIAVD